MPSVESTRYVYDGDRLVESVTVRSPEFTADDLALLRASVERDRTNQYGVPLDEAYDKKNINKWHGASMVDFSAAVVDRYKDQLRKQYPDDPLYGHVFYAEES